METPNPNPMAEEESHSAVDRRIQRLYLHLTNPKPSTPPVFTPDHPLKMQTYAAAKGKKLEVDTSLLSQYMRGKHRNIQEKVFEYFNSRPDLQTPVEILKDDHRELCMKQLLGLVREAGIRPFRHVAEDPEKYFAIAEAVGGVDMSLGIMMGVQYSLGEALC